MIRRHADPCPRSLLEGERPREPCAPGGGPRRAAAQPGRHGHVTRAAAGDSRPPKRPRAARLDGGASRPSLPGPWMARQARKWSGGGSNSQPRHCERRALPVELPPRSGNRCEAVSQGKFDGTGAAAGCPACRRFVDGGPRCDAVFLTRSIAMHPRSLERERLPWSASVPASRAHRVAIHTAWHRDPHDLATPLARRLRPAALQSNPFLGGFRPGLLVGSSWFRPRRARRRRRRTIVILYTRG